MLSNRTAIAIFVTILTTSLCSATLLADPPKNKGKSDKIKMEKGADKHGIELDASLSIMVSAGISVGDARQLASKYHLTGGKPLPAGIRKNLARGKPMPPGIQKTRMPDSFINQLPVHKGYEWHQAGTDLVLVIAGSLVISDVLEGVFD